MLRKFGLGIQLLNNELLYFMNWKTNSKQDSFLIKINYNIIFIRYFAIQLPTTDQQHLHNIKVVYLETSNSIEKQSNVLRGSQKH